MVEISAFVLQVAISYRFERKVVIGASLVIVFHTWLWISFLKRSGKFYPLWCLNVGSQLTSEVENLWTSTLSICSLPDSAFSSSFLRLLGFSERRSDPLLHYATCDVPLLSLADASFARWCRFRPAVTTLVTAVTGPSSFSFSGVFRSFCFVYVCVCVFAGFHLDVLNLCVCCSLL